MAIMTPRWAPSPGSFGAAARQSPQRMEPGKLGAPAQGYGRTSQMASVLREPVGPEQETLLRVDIPSSRALGRDLA